MNPFSEHFLTPLAMLPGETPVEKSTSQESMSPYKESMSLYKDSAPRYKDKKLPLMATLYVGSLTVIGLFIVFRFIQKSR